MAKRELQYGPPIKLQTRGHRRNFRQHHCRLSFEQLEDRHVLATIVVTTLIDAAVTGPDSAPGTLRQAIYDANVAADVDVIEFAPDLVGSVNLALAEDTLFGPTALVVSTPITIRGNANGIAIARDTSTSVLRLFQVTAGASLTLDSITVTGGMARGADGTTIGENGAIGLGGAVFNQGTLSIIASAFIANSAIGGFAGAGGQDGPSRGGAIYSEEGAVHVINSTFSGNVVASGAVAGAAQTFGGAVYAINGTVTIRNSTLTNNTAFTGRGLYVLAHNGTATVDIRSSILGQSDAQITKREFLTAEDENGNFVVTGGNNLIRTQGDFHYITTSVSDPLLGPLMNHGGPTPTHALGAGSPAIDAGSNEQVLVADQRGGGFARVVGSAADMGAFEVQTAVGPEVPGDYNQNNVVDAADFVLWRKILGTIVPNYSGADGDGDGEVSVFDYSVWRSHFGGMSSSGSGEQALLANSMEGVEVGTKPGGSAVLARSESGITLDVAPYAAGGPRFTGYRRIISDQKEPAILRAHKELVLLELMSVRSPRPISAASMDFSAMKSLEDCDEVIVDAVFDKWPNGSALEFR